MAVTWGHYGKFSVSSTYNGTPVEVTGLDSTSLNQMRDLIEVQKLSDGTYKKRLATLEDWSIDLSGAFIDEAAQGSLRALLRSGAQVWFTYTLDSGATIGYKAATAGGGAFVENFKVGATNTGEVTFSCTLKANQALELIGTPES